MAASGSHSDLRATPGKTRSSGHEGFILFSVINGGIKQKILPCSLQNRQALHVKRALNLSSTRPRYYNDKSFLI